MVATGQPPEAAFSPTYQDFVHTGPGTLAGRYLRMFWQPVAYAQDVLPGRSVPIRIMSEDHTLYRGEDGAPHLVGFRCAHRSTQLSAGWVEGDCIRCFYHGWKYDASGQCVEQPAEEAPFAQKVKIPGYPVQEYLGLVFAYLGEGEPPPLPRYPEFEAFDGVLEISDHAYIRHCNYFNNVDNIADYSHLGFVHRGHNYSYDGAVARPKISIEESDWGLTMTIERLSAAGNTVQYTALFGMPNMAQIFTMPHDPAIGWVENLFWWVPLDDESFQQFAISRVFITGQAANEYRERQAARKAKRDLDHTALARSVLAGQLRPEEVDPDRVNLVTFQDDVAQIGQGAIVDRARDRLGQADVGVIKIRQLWARELKAFAEGRPLKAWTKPPGLVPRYPAK